MNESDKVGDVPYKIWLTQGRNDRIWVPFSVLPFPFIVLFKQCPADTPKSSPMQNPYCARFVSRQNASNLNALAFDGKVDLAADRV